MTWGNLSSADTVEYLWICYSSLLLCRLKCCLLIFQNYSELSVSRIKLSQLQRPWPSISRGQALMGVCEWRQVTWRQTCQLIKLSYLSTSYSSQGSCRMLSMSQLWLFFSSSVSLTDFQAQGPSAISHGLDKSGLLSSSSRVHKQSRHQLLYKPASSLKPSFLCVKGHTFAKDFLRIYPKARTKEAKSTASTDQFQEPQEHFSPSLSRMSFYVWLLWRGAKSEIPAAALRKLFFFT